MKRPLFLAALLLATTAFAQETLDMRPKHSSTVDGSLSISKSNSTGFGLDLGGTLVKDRVWFFASAERSAPMFTTSYAQPQVRAIDTKAVATIGDRQNLSAMFSSQTIPVTSSLSVPTNFLSLHYTAVVSSNSFFTMNVSETKR